MNGIYLYLLLREIRSRLLGAHVESISARDRVAQLTLGENALIISLHPTGLGLFLSEKEWDGYELVKTMNDVVRSCKIADVLQPGLTPVMRILLEKDFPTKERPEITISLYPEAPNIVLKTKGVQRRFLSRYTEKKPKASILDLDDAQPVKSTVEHLVSHFEGIDKKMAGELTRANIKSLKAILKGSEAIPKLLSIVPIRVSLFAKQCEMECSSFNELFRIALTGFLRAREMDEAEHQKRSAIRVMRRRIVRLQKRLRTTEEIEQLRIRGELILANIAKIKKGKASISVLNPYTQEQMEIGLEQNLSAQENARRYFTRYKKEKRGQPKLREQIRTLSEKIDDLQGRPYVRPKRGTKDTSIPSVKEPFHKFHLDSGAILFVGKNARSNDELTFKHARPGDYFFHTRGFEGSHVILRPNIPKGQRPSRDEMIAAASIAAYFSKARKQHNVPVSYCQRKYLKKNRKGKIGSVILMREEVVFVDPGLPAEK